MIYGKRVECEEVENVLCEQPQVETAVVTPQTDSDGMTFLVAYIVPRSERFNLDTVKHAAAEQLASFMMPEFWKVMERMPMTPNGKVDRKALPQVRKEGCLYD